jgi:hypothetical protein
MLWIHLFNKIHASLSQTGFKSNLLNQFESCLSGDPYLDIRFWEIVKSKKYVFQDLESKFHLHCSMKGMKGRKGIGTGHNPRLGGYKLDVKLETLIKWVGEENAKIYMKYVGQSYESAKLIGVGIDKERNRVGGRVPQRMPSAPQPPVPPSPAKQSEVKPLPRRVAPKRILPPPPPVRIRPRRSVFPHKPGTVRRMPPNWR